MSRGGLTAMKPAFTRKRTRAVFFDVHGTLIKRERNWRQGFEQAIGEFVSRLADSKGTPQEAAERYWRALRNRRSRKAAASPDRRRHLRAMKVALAGLDIPLTPSFLASLYRRTRTLSARQPVAAPGARAALGKLARHYRLGIISNSNRDALADALARTGLDRFFDKEAIFTSAQTGWRKPDRRLFRTALGAFGIKPDQAVMIGDSWQRDVLGSVRCGMNAVHLHKRNKKTGRRKRRNPTVLALSRFDQLTRWFDN